MADGDQVERVLVVTAHPRRVLTQSPVRNLARIQASHPDHLATGEAALCAVYPDARNPFAHPELLDEGLEPWVVGQVWLMGTPTPDTWVDVTDVYDRKIAALRSHVTQLPGVADLDGLLRGWLGAQAAAAGYAEGRLAEAFQVIQIT